MRVAVTSRSPEADGALKSYAREKLSNLDHLVARPMQAHAVFTKERFKFVVEVVLTVNGEAIKVLAKDEDGRAAVDGAVAKLDARLRRLKGRLTEHRPAEVRRAARVRRATKVPDALSLDVPAPVFASTDAYAEESMTPELAAAQLEERGLHVLLFKNSRTKRSNVVYRTSDGSFGLIESAKRAR